MKTLLVYYSNHKRVREMCETSARADVDVLELRPRYARRPLLDAPLDAYRALTGKGVRLAPIEVDLSLYDSIVLVSSLCAFAPSPECNEFLYRCDLQGLEVTCLICGRSNSPTRAGSKLRRRVRLAGGICRDVVFVSEQKLAAATGEMGVFSLPQTTQNNKISPPAKI